jgi:hypothetical protein
LYENFYDWQCRVEVMKIVGEMEIPTIK